MHATKNQSSCSPTAPSPTPVSDASVAALPLRLLAVGGRSGGPPPPPSAEEPARATWKRWQYKYDLNNDGKISYEELYNEL